MIPVKEHRTADLSEEFREYRFGVREGGLAHIFHILRNQIYSDRIMAVVREYGCNGYDAHVQAGKPDLPIILTLPTMLEPEFRVRDFGPGLSELEIQDVYANYGESTKRESNAYTGQLGLGSKAAFCYGDNFVIISYCQGKKTTYNAYIDPSQVGKIARMHVEDTEEPEGTEIRVPVQAGDIPNFQSKAQYFARYCRIHPTLQRADPAYKPPEPMRSWEGPDWLFGVANQNSLTAAGPSKVVMGNVTYPLDLKQVPGMDGSWLSSGLTLYLPIGMVAIAASREALQYNDPTKKSLKEVLTRVAGEIIETVQKSIKDAPTYWAALVAYNKLNSDSSQWRSSYHCYGNNSTSFYQACMQGVTWRGRAITNGRIAIPRELQPKLVLAHVPGGCVEREKDFAQDIWAREDTILVVNDNVLRAGISYSKAYTSALRRENKTAEIYFLTFFSETYPEAEAEFRRLIDLEGAPLRKLSEIEITPEDEETEVEGERPPPRPRRARSEIDVLTLEYTNYPNWKEVRIPLEKGEGEEPRYWSAINRNYLIPEEIGVVEKYSLKYFLDTTRKLKLELPPLVAVRTAHVPRVKEHPDWSPWWEEVRRRVLDRLTQDGVKDNFYLQGYRGKYDWFLDVLIPDRGKIERADSPLHAYLKLGERLKQVNGRDPRGYTLLCQTLTYPYLFRDEEPLPDPEVLLAQTIQDYPLLQVVSRYGYLVGEEHRNACIEYINLLDKNRQLQGE